MTGVQTCALPISLRIGGIVVERATKRTYPERALAGQLIGFVDFDGHGQYGVEGRWEEQLAGKPGRLRSEKDTEGHEIGIGSRDLRPPVDGLDTYLTIDRTIQYIAEREQALAHIEQQITEAQEALRALADEAAAAA